MWRLVFIRGNFEAELSGLRPYICLFFLSDRQTDWTA